MQLNGVELLIPRLCCFAKRKKKANEKSPLSALACFTLYTAATEL